MLELRKFALQIAHDASAAADDVLARAETYFGFLTKGTDESADAYDASSQPEPPDDVADVPAPVAAPVAEPDPCRARTSSGN